MLQWVEWVRGMAFFCMYRGARRDSCNNDFPVLCAETCQKFHLDSFRYICILFRLTTGGGGLQTQATLNCGFIYPSV